jgi:hypothetical protein
MAKKKGSEKNPCGRWRSPPGDLCIDRETTNGTHSNQNQDARREKVGMDQANRMCTNNEEGDL